MAPVKHRPISCASTEASVDLQRGAITACGNGTVHFSWAGVNLIADPCFGAGSTLRLANAASPDGPCATIDAMLLSHLRADTGVTADMPPAFSAAPIITVPNAVRSLAAAGFRNVHALDTWESIALRKGDASVTVIAAPAQHGARALIRSAPDLMSMVLELRPRPNAEPCRVFLSSGTLSVEEIEEVPERFPRIDIAVLHLGGARIGRLPVTMDARHGLELIDMLKPARTFLVPYRDDLACLGSLSDLRAELRRRALDDHVAMPSTGIAYRFRLPALAGALPINGLNGWRPAVRPSTNSTQGTARLAQT